MALRHFLNQEITYKNPSGTYDRQGVESLGTAVTTGSRFERKYKIRLDKDKEQIPTHGTFIVGPDDEIAIGAQIEYNDELFRVLEVTEAPGRRGQVHHYELLCQLWSWQS